MEREFILSQKPSFFILHLIKQSLLYGKKPDISFLSKQFERMPPKLKATNTGKIIIEKLRIIAELSVENLAPNFQLPDISGNLVELTDFRGKVVLLDFWSSDCGPCRKQHPSLIELYNNFKSSGLEIISVSLDTEKNEWLDAIKTDGLTWPQLSNLKDFKNNEITKMYNLRAIPDSYLIDSHGKIIAKKLSIEELSERLKQLFTK